MIISKFQVLIRDSLKIQLKRNKSKLDLYNFIYSFDYLDPRFSITYNDKPIGKLSPGAKGILLLALYLLIDDSKLPIIIDQPEENIGNKTIYNRLVKFIQEAKQDRQIIIVTNNANLAIVCDARSGPHQLDSRQSKLRSYFLYYYLQIKEVVRK